MAEHEVAFLRPGLGYYTSQFLIDKTRQVVDTVQRNLAGFVLLQADVTPNDEKDQQLYDHFKIIGPPAIVFYDKSGKERRNLRVVGYMPAAEFASVISRI